MLEKIIESTNQYIASMPKKERKKYGQFFTSKETARFMAELFVIPETMSKVCILDAGAGSGILSCAFLERLAQLDWVQTVELTCYENNADILKLLKENMNMFALSYKKDVQIKIITDNYITSQYLDFNQMLEGSLDPQKYDFVIGNPPYMKIAKDAPEAAAMPEICYGAPNLYFLFAAMGLFNLKDDGELVFIIPRSWTSGAYFKRFRQYFLTKGKLEHIHLFVSRSKVFDKEDVLQETMIIKVKKTKDAPKEIIITSSQSNDDFADLTSLAAPYSLVVSGKDAYVYLVTDKTGISVLERLNKYDKTLPDIGLKMKTGLTVDFRNRECLRDKAEEGAVPLFYSQHIKHGQVRFPIQKENEYIVTDQKGLMQDNRNYLFVKRFTAKEERRRLQCGIYLSKEYPQYQKISTQNKINFVDGLTMKLSECIVYGLYVIFNSTLYDDYYRILNGSTQVNSTEINAMPVPELEHIKEMGRMLMESKDMSEDNCNRILEYTADKVEEAKEILKMLGMPKAQQSDTCGYVLLALAGIKQHMEWAAAKNEWMRIHDMIQFVNTSYSTYAENSRETFRKKALHHFRNAALIEDNGEATNSPKYKYRLTEEALQMLKAFRSSNWQEALNQFLEAHDRLMDIYASKKKMTMMPVCINGNEFQFSAGKHNALQKAIIEEFAPRFAPGAECLYVGDTIEKDLVKNVRKLKELGFEITLHDKMPDVVLYREDKNWIYFVESVTSVGPMDAKRILEINDLTRNVTAGKIFVTAFLDFSTYKKFSECLAWETEVWIAQMPEHMIHLNGDKFLGPRNCQ